MQLWTMQLAPQLGCSCSLIKVDLFDFQICFEFRLKVIPGICALFDQRRPVIGRLLLTLIQKMTQQLMWHVYSFRCFLRLSFISFPQSHITRGQRWTFGQRKIRATNIGRRVAAIVQYVPQNQEQVDPKTGSIIREIWWRLRRFDEFQCMLPKCHNSSRDFRIVCVFTLRPFVPMWVLFSTSMGKWRKSIKWPKVTFRGLI